MIIMIIAELSGRCRQSPIVLGEEGQSLGTKDALSIGPLNTHWSHVFINPVRYIDKGTNFKRWIWQCYFWISPTFLQLQLEMKSNRICDYHDNKNSPYLRYPKKCFTLIYRDLYGDAMLVPTWMGTNMADGNQQKHLLPSFGTKAWIYSSRNS